MQNILKQFGGKATDSFEKRWRRSLLWLTLIYASALAIILLISGAFTHTLFSSRLQTRFRGFPPPPGVVVDGYVRPLPTEAEVREDLIGALFVVNGALLLLSAILSYFLAKRTLAPIKKAYLAQQRFIGDASHELRTPLTILKMELENELHEKSIAEHSRKKIESKLEEVVHMTTIVNNLLTLSRLDESQAESVVRSAIDLGPFLSKTITLLSPLAAAHHVSVQFDPTKTYAITSNESLLEEIVRNVIKNAIVYNKENGSVVIKMEAHEKKVVVSVIDTGIGIRPLDQAQLFTRFYRVEKSRTRERGGSGLGLSIVKTALEKVGGSIEIQSTFGEGTTVTLSFPHA